MPLLSLPNELFLQIASSLDCPALLSLILTNRRLSHLLTPTLFSHAPDTIARFTTALFFAATSSNAPALHALLSLPPTLTDSPDDRNTTTTTDITIHTLHPPSHVPQRILYHPSTLRLGPKKTTRDILTHAPNLLIRDRRYGRSPLHFAATAGNTALTRSLLARGHPVNVKDDDHDSPFLCALRSGHTATARLLLEAGADVNAAARNGHTTFHLTVSWGHVEIAEMMLDRGVDIEGRDRDGHTVLHDAANGASVDMVRMLLRRGANVNARVEKWLGGDTALHLATLRGNKSVVEALVEGGADRTIRGRDWKLAGECENGNAGGRWGMGR